MSYKAMQETNIQSAPAVWYVVDETGKKIALTDEPTAKMITDTLNSHAQLEAAVAEARELLNEWHSKGRFWGGDVPAKRELADSTADWLERNK
jgi:hypothetical protein